MDFTCLLFVSLLVSFIATLSVLFPFSCFVIVTHSFTHLHIMSNERSADQTAEEFSIRCEEIIRKYRQGERRGRTIQDLAGVFRASGDFSGLPAYLEMLDEHDREIKEAGARGEVRTGGERSGLLEASGRDRAGADGDGEGSGHRDVSLTLSTGRRARSPREREEVRKKRRRGYVVRLDRGHRS